MKSDDIDEKSIGAIVWDYWISMCKSFALSFETRGRLKIISCP